MIHIKLPENKNLVGIVQGCTLGQLPDGFERLQDLFAELKRRFRRYRNLDERRGKDALILREAVLRGELDFAQPTHKFGQVNQIHNTFFQDLFAHFDGTYVSDQNLKFEHFVIGNSFKEINPADSTLWNEIYRRVPDTVVNDGGSTCYASTLLNQNQGNPDLNTTVTAATISSITVANATGAIVNGRIQIVTAQNTYYATISNITGPLLDLTAITDLGGRTYTSFDVTDIPQVGDFVDGIHCEAGIASQTTSSMTPYTGFLLARRLYQFAKRTGTVAESVLYDYIFAFYSVR